MQGTAVAGRVVDRYRSNENGSQQEDCVGDDEQMLKRKGAGGHSSTVQIASDAMPSEPSTRVGRDHVERLYQQKFDSLVSSLRAKFGSGPPDPEEVAQRAFARIFERGALPECADHAKSLLWRTASNIAISELRSIQVRRHYGVGVSSLNVEMQGYHSEPERVLLAKEQIAVVLRVLESMPKQRRRVFMLVRIEGLTHAQAAKRLGISRPAVSKHVALAVAELYAAAKRA